MIDDLGVNKPTLPQRRCLEGMIVIQKSDFPLEGYYLQDTFMFTSFSGGARSVVVCAEFGFLGFRVNT